MSECLPRDVLLRVGGRTLLRHGVPVWAGSNRADEYKEAFSRADASTCATYIDRDGIVRVAAAGVPRVEWVDLDGDGIRETPGLLLEGSRTNGWTRSEELNDGAWTKDAASVSADVGRGMDGTLHGDKIVEDGTNALHGFERNTPALTDNTKSSVSVFAAYFGTRTWFRIRTQDKSGALNSTWFNIANGTIGTTAAGHSNVKIEGPLGLSGAQGYRCSLTFDSTSGATTPLVQFFLALADNTGAYAGDGASGMIFTDVMFETDKPFRSSYIKTVAATVTRAADSFTLPFNFGPTDLTVLARVARPVHADAVGVLAVHCGVFKLSTSLEMYFTSGGRNIQSDVNGAGSSSASQAIPAGSSITAVAQYTGFTAAAKTKLDVGSGFSAFSTTQAIASFPDQVLTVGFSQEGGSDRLYGVLLDLIIVRDLRTLAEVLAIP